MTKDEALAFDLALEALESCTPEDTSTGHVVWPSYDEQAVEQAITAVKQARSAPVQSCYCPNCEAMGKELAALKAQPAPVQEPVGVYGHCPVCGAKGVTRERRPDGDDRCANGHTYKSIHATTPPAAQRQWVGLTEKELRKMHHEEQFGLFCDYDEFEQIVRATEQAHGITEGQP